MDEKIQGALYSNITTPEKNAPSLRDGMMKGEREIEHY